MYFFPSESTNKFIEEEKIHPTAEKIIFVNTFI